MAKLEMAEDRDADVSSLFVPYMLIKAVVEGSLAMLGFVMTYRTVPLFSEEKVYPA